MHVALSSVHTYHRPTDPGEVAALLNQFEESALLVSGGTFLHGLGTRGLLAGVESLIDLTGLGLDAIEERADGLCLGATVRFRQLLEFPSLRSGAAAAAIGDALDYPPVQILNTATLGGCVASSCPFFDLPVSLLALDATVLVTGGGGERQVPLDQFFTGLFETVLEPGEFVSGLSLPRPAQGSVSAFLKLETNANDLAILNVAASVGTDASGTCCAARIFIGGGVGESPVRATAAEQVLIGSRLEPEAIEAAGEAAAGEVDPISDHRASASYRRAMAGVYTRRVLQRVRQRIHPEGAA